MLTVTARSAPSMEPGQRPSGAPGGDGGLNSMDGTSSIVVLTLPTVVSIEHERTKDPEEQ